VRYSLNQFIIIKVNGELQKCKIFGYEHDGTNWIYHLEIPEFDLDIKVLEGILVQGINVVTNGYTLRIESDNEKAKAK